MARYYQYDVYLSYNSADRERVRDLAVRLHEAGVRVWFDEWAIKPGDDIVIAVERGLEASQRLVLCLSTAALGSKWVSLERTTAIFRDPSNEDRRFIPLLLEDCDLPDSLMAKKYVDFRDEDDDAFQQLLEVCLPDDDGSDSEWDDTPTPEDNELTSDDEPSETVWTPVGTVSRFLDKTGKAVVELDGDVQLGDLLLFGDGDDAMEQRVFSLEVDGRTSFMAGAGEKARIKVDLQVRAGESVYRADNFPAGEEIGNVIRYEPKDSTVWVELIESIREGDEIEVRDGNQYSRHPFGSLSLGAKQLSKGMVFFIKSDNHVPIDIPAFPLKDNS